MRKGRKRYTKKNVIQAAIPTLVLFLLVCALTYYVFNTDWLNPRINEITASYISLNNNDTTDMLKITNLRKMSDNKGKSDRNNCTQSFQVLGSKNAEYKIVLYHLGNSVEEEYVNFYLTNEKGNKIEGILGEQEETYDGGKVLYEGTIQKGKKWNLKMWVDKEEKKEIENVSYEIRIKAR